MLHFLLLPIIDVKKVGFRMSHTEGNVDESKWCVLVESCLCESVMIIERSTFNRKLIPKAGKESRLQIKKITSNTSFPYGMLPKLSHSW